MFVSRVEWLVSLARELSTTAGAGDAFFAFFAALVGEAAANRGLADALTGVGFDIKAAVSGPDRDVTGALAALLAKAQEARAVRADVDVADVMALVAGCLARQPDGSDPAARDRMVAVVRAGLRRE